MRVCLAATRTVQFFARKMKWFLAGMALVITMFAAGIAAIVVGYRQVIGRYMGEAGENLAANDGERDLPTQSRAVDRHPLRRSRAKPNKPKASSPQPVTTE